MSENRSPVSRIVRGAVQNLGSAYFARLVNWAANILLMRRLAETDFDSVAFALSLLLMIGSLRKFGLHVALLHHHDRFDDLVGAHFALNTVIGLASMLVTVATGMLFILGWKSDTVVAALVIFAVADLLRALVQTSETELRHQLRFGWVALSHSTATLIASGTSIVLVYAGFGVWSLIAGFSINSVTYVVAYAGMIWGRRPPKFRDLFRIDREAAASLMRYGRWFWVANILQALSLQFDRFVVGVALPRGVLGFYDRAHVFAQMPTGAVTHTILSVTGTVYARYQNDRVRLSAAFRRVLRLIFRSTLPITLVLVVEAPTFIQLLVGERWLPLVPILRWLCVYTICRPVLDDVQALLMGIGHPKAVAGFVGAQAGVLLLLTPLLTHRWGTVGAAVSMDLAALVGLVLALRIASRSVDIPWFRAFAPPAAAAVVALGLRVWLSPTIAALPPLFSCVAGAGVLTVGYTGVLLALERGDLIEEIGRLRSAFTEQEGDPNRDSE